MPISSAVGLRSVVVALVMVCGLGVGNLPAAPTSFSGSGFVVHPEGYVVRPAGFAELPIRLDW